jgi:CRISPR-associated endonuclease Csn1
VTAKGEVIQGYFKSFGIDGCSMVIACPKNPRINKGSPGSKTLIRFTKQTVDRLGNISAISREVRTWHGEACT